MPVALPLLVAIEYARSRVPPWAYPLGSTPLGLPPGPTPFGAAAQASLRAKRVDSSEMSDTARRSIGPFPLGLFPLGRFPLGLFPLGLFPLGLFPLGRFPLGRFPLGRFPLTRRCPAFPVRC